MVSAHFKNLLPLDVRIDWSNKGGAGPALQSQIAHPLEVVTFRHGRFSNIDFGIFVMRDGNWIKIDQDWVWLLRDRRGAIIRVEHPVVDWGAEISLDAVDIAKSLGREGSQAYHADVADR